MSRWMLHADAPETQVVIAWCPRASPEHSNAKPGAACALRYSSAALQPDAVARARRRQQTDGEHWSAANLG
jgi:hypothetical protein